MITINGQKMGKSLGNFITLNELFTGTHKLLTQAYTPMTIRFFILQAQYRGTLDFSNEALQAAEKGYKRMMQAAKDVKSLKVSASVSEKNKNASSNGKSEEQKTLMQQIEELYNNMYDALCDDLNTPVALSYLFEAVKIVNQAKDGTITVGSKEKELLERIFSEVAMNVLGLKDEDESAAGNGGTKIVDGLMDLVLAERKEAREKKDWAKSDVIRDTLNKLGIKVKDNKEGGTDWSIE
jgi:cysteinyl-tRNA synthetase